MSCHIYIFSFLGNRNNYFIYAEPNNGKYHIFSYDFDSTLGKWCNSKEVISHQYLLFIIYLLFIYYLFLFFFYFLHFLIII